MSYEIKTPRRMPRIFRFGILRRLRRGARITIYPTLRCNYDCFYCSQKTYNGEEPPSENEMDLQGWIDTLSLLQKHMRIQHACVTGGEPFIKKESVALIDWLIEQGIFVSVYTNLSTKRSLEIKNNKRLRFVTTYHHHADKERYLYRLSMHAEKGFLMIVEEIGHQNIDKEAIAYYKNKYPNVKFKAKRFEPLDDDSGGMSYRFVIAPDGSMFVNQNKMQEYLNKRYNTSGLLNIGGNYEQRLIERKEKLSKV